MSTMDTRLTTEPTSAPMLRSPTAWVWVKNNLLSSPVNIILTGLVLWLLVLTVPAFIDWAILKANVSAQTGDVCRKTGGACWAIVVQNYRLMLLRTYPYDEQWRPLIACLLLLSVIAVSGWRRFWKPPLAVAWALVLLAVAILMWGGVLGLPYVENSLWGGLPVTLLLATFGIVFAFPLGVVLALGRRSKMPAIKSISVIYIELIRGVPMISLLFMASVMLPLFLPQGMNIDKLLRALVAIIMFAAAYIAEIVRGGLQAIPKGQYEGADSLGLGYWQQMRLVILPQALKVVIPPMVSIFIAMFKDTSLVVIIGIFDLTLSAKAALVNQEWRGFSVEVYLFIAAIYFIFCYSMSRYSQALEKRLATGHQR